MTTTDKVQQAESTAGTSTSANYYTIPPYHGERGWLCPRCGRVNAPWVRQCDCSDNNWTITCGDTAGDEWWKKYVTITSDTFRMHPESAPTYEVGGSDYYDKTTNTWTNVVKNCSNCKEK